jgi:hypothetical protein
MQLHTPSVAAACGAGRPTRMQTPSTQDVQSCAMWNYKYNSIVLMNFNEFYTSRRFYKLCVCVCVRDLAIRYNHPSYTHAEMV